MYDRVISLIGMDKFKVIQEKTVLVVGLGGVGGTALESLVRSGIKKIILIDNDIVDVSNLNRQIITNRLNIGTDKVLAAKKRIMDINPEIEVITRKIFLEEENIEVLNEYQIDYIVDACDTIKTKELLIDYSIDKNIKLISSMGTANKIDPTKLKIMDIRNTSYDPIAKIIRKYVAKEKIKNKIMVVSSDEKPIENKKLSTMMFVPSTAGLLCANYIIRDIIDKQE